MKPIVTFLLNDIPARPGGGVKVILEYANLLSRSGYQVRIAYPGFLDWKKAGMMHKCKLTLHYLRSLIKGWRCNKWFELDRDVKEIHPLSLNFRHIPPSDIYIATEARTAPYLAQYPIENHRKYYFIQGYENWHLSEKELWETYRYPLKKIVISGWLKKMLAEKGIDSEIVPNHFDFEYFRCQNKIEDRKGKVVSMMYSDTPLKDVGTTLKALDIVKSKIPDLKVEAFGTLPRPNNLPEWINYHRSPDREEHNAIYNYSAVFVASSRSEGWGLTVGEAMICGSAVACTDIEGYREMVSDNITGLLSAPGDAHGLAKNIIRLLEDNELRIRIAKTGNENIRRFTKESSLEKFINILK
ncbi:MAG: glycosyltransferase family 4 protein [Muribaculaceae bacterium]|nr:glycosyltransferase family 4 protein [Muribaculaceae bacterium]